MPRGPVRKRLLGLMISSFGCLVVLAGCGDAGPGTEHLTFGGANMSPTLERGDSITVTDVPDAYVPQRGQIVEFDDPGGWLTPSDGPPESGPRRLISRVVAVPGDRIACCTSRGLLEINGRPLKEPYLAALRGRCAAELYPPAGQRRCAWRVGPVPRGDVFVLGDNRVNSADSRLHVCPPRPQHCATSPWVPVSAIVGTVDVP